MRDPCCCATALKKLLLPATPQCLKRSCWLLRTEGHKAAHAQWKCMPTTPGAAAHRVRFYYRVYGPAAVVIFGLSVSRISPQHQVFMFLPSPSSCDTSGRHGITLRTRKCVVQEVCRRHACMGASGSSQRERALGPADEFRHCTTCQHPRLLHHQHPGTPRQGTPCYRTIALTCSCLALKSPCRTCNT